MAMLGVGVSFSTSEDVHLVDHLQRCYTWCLLLVAQGTKS